MPTPDSSEYIKKKKHTIIQSTITSNKLNYFTTNYERSFSGIVLSKFLQNNQKIPSRIFSRIPSLPPAAPLGVSSDIFSFARTLLSTFSNFDVAPSVGTALTVNNQSIGTYEYTTRKNSTSISSFNASDWFTSTKDTVSSWITVNGDLTIDAGQILTPSVRKLFTVLYVSGNLICNGTITMTGRGSNHSGTGDSGGFIAPVDIRIGSGTFTSVTNPQIPSSGGTGGSGITEDNSRNNGVDGSNGGTGGGGSGGKFGGTRSGTGSAGTCFSGGTGGGGTSAGTSSNGATNGGAGGDFSGTQASGGTGNPGGSIESPYKGGNGTGGTLIVIVGGTLFGNGTISANGVAGSGGTGTAGGGASGGGSVTVLYGSDSSSITPVASGGTINGGLAGGAGGSGTARKLAIGAN